MRLIAWAIPGLVISLLLIEFFNFRLYDEIDHRVINALTAGNDANSSLAQLRAAVAAILRTARDQTEPAVPHSDVVLVDDFVRSLGSSGRLPSEKIKILETCAAQLRPPAAGSSSVSVADRRAATNACLDALDTIPIGPALDSQQLQALRDVSKEALDARQAARTFWLQIVQFVLLNLLLPTLTALLGYIFGSQQRSS